MSESQLSSAIELCEDELDSIAGGIGFPLFPLFGSNSSNSKSNSVNVSNVASAIANGLNSQAANQITNTISIS